MSLENNSGADNNGNSPRARRGSFTATTFNNLFGRTNSVSGPQAGTTPLPTPIVTTNPAAPARRMSITTLGLSGTSPIQTANYFPGRRASISTAGSDSIDENAIDEEDGPARSMPTTPFTRRMSFGAQALFNARQGSGSGSPGSTGRASSYTTSAPLASISDDVSSFPSTQSKTQASKASKPRSTSNVSFDRSADGLNWSEQFRSRAESTLTRPTFGPNAMPAPKSPNMPTHDRSKSFGEMPSPPTAAIPPPQRVEQKPLSRRPDAIGERMLRGDFHMD
jgi:hypothetical protein